MHLNRSVADQQRYRFFFLSICLLLVAFTFAFAILTVHAQFSRVNLFASMTLRCMFTRFKGQFTVARPIWIRFTIRLIVISDFQKGKCWCVHWFFREKNCIFHLIGRSVANWNCIFPAIDRYGCFFSLSILPVQWIVYWAMCVFVANEAINLTMRPKCWTYISNSNSKCFINTHKQTRTHL